MNNNQNHDIDNEHEEIMEIEGLNKQSKKQKNVEKSKKEKTKKSTIVRTILGFMIDVTLIVTFVLYIYLGWTQEIENINQYLDAAIKSIFVIACAAFLKRVVMVITRYNFSSQRARTVSTLLRSLIKYAIAIVAVILILVIFLGQDYITELLAGLGVIGLVVGLGCQTLINDIVAGIFIVFEGNYHVGDVVVLNGWRGTVVEIGLRTIVIEDVGGNKSVINNASISEIVNNSKALSVASCVVGIEYEESLEKIEKLIKDNLEKIKERIPAIETGPTYKGVSELAPSSVNLLIVCTCKEEKKYQIQRDLNREFKLLFEANNINFPSPHTTISMKKDNVNINDV